MTTTGTYAWLPSVGELAVAAFRRIQIHRAEILAEHLADAKNETNLLQVEWAAKGPLLWTVGVNTVPLVQGQAVYSVPSNVIMMLDVYISDTISPGTYSDRILYPFSRTEYASTPNKSQQGSPTSFWFDRLIAPTFTLWPVPDGTEPSISYYYFSQIQDSAMANALVPQVPYFWLDAYVAGLAWRLSVIYPPKNPLVDYKSIAREAYDIASTQGTENVPLFIAPTTQSYWR